VSDRSIPNLTRAVVVGGDASVQISWNSVCRVNKRGRFSVGLSEWRERKMDFEAMLEKGGGMRDIS
jgi:hypothetical protein